VGKSEPAGPSNVPTSWRGRCHWIPESINSALTACSTRQHSTVILGMSACSRAGYICSLPGLIAPSNCPCRAYLHRLLHALYTVDSSNGYSVQSYWARGDSDGRVSRMFMFHISREIALRVSLILQNAGSGQPRPLNEQGSEVSVLIFLSIGY
jgi:hypothetical protein